MLMLSYSESPLIFSLAINIKNNFTFFLPLEGGPGYHNCYHILKEGLERRNTCQ